MGTGRLDSSITDLHGATDAANQKQAENALKEVETALDQLKAQDPDAAFKNMPQAKRPLAIARLGNRLTVLRPIFVAS
jgi:ABC-type transporter Mla subunit MlaD